MKPLCLRRWLVLFKLSFQRNLGGTDYSGEGPGTASASRRLRFLFCGAELVRPRGVHFARATLTEAEEDLSSCPLNAHRQGASTTSTMSATAGPVPAAIAPQGGAGSAPRQQRAFKTQDKPDEVRRSNMNAAKAVSDAIRTSLGPKGMDKMVGLALLIRLICKKS